MNGTIVAGAGAILIENLPSPTWIILLGVFGLLSVLLYSKLFLVFQNFLYMK
jgi:hypothetical protein